jgi:arylsulfatase A-like enzyme
MRRRDFLPLACAAPRAWAADSPPNIVLLYADDLGYGDTRCYGATAVGTPNIDRLAARGVRFTDAHSTAATCTPSRYSLLTGEYAFRLPKARVLPGDAPLLIPPSRPTLASVLRSRGYRTAMVGKWHLGLGQGQIDWNAAIQPGPLETGFDESFIIPATGDRVPCVYVDGHHVANLDPRDPIRVSYEGPLDDQPTGKSRPDLLRMKPSHGHDMTIVNGISRIGYMSGGRAAQWKDDEMADVLTRRAVRTIDANRSRPFFLYFATHDIHVPRVPHARFSSATPLGPRGNVIAEFDWSVGEIVKALERNRLLENTLIVLSSDNGAVVDDGYQDEAVTRLGRHRPNGRWRGGKYSSFEAGTRVPFLVHWPARARPGVSDALVSQVDLLRSLAAAAGAAVPAGSARDSQNLLPALVGETPHGRDTLVLQAATLALRQGPWKYIEPGDGEPLNRQVNIETGISPQPQLYHLGDDPGETRNLAATQPARVQEMQRALDAER